MSPGEIDPREQVLELALSAYRAMGPTGRILPSPAWLDLAPDQREALYEAQIESRMIERAVHPSGLSTTARAVLSRISQIRQLPPGTAEG